MCLTVIVTACMHACVRTMTMYYSPSFEPEVTKGQLPAAAGFV